MCGGAAGSACLPPATLSLRLHRPQAAPARVGNSVSPIPSHPHPVKANPRGGRRERVTGQGPGAKTADAYGARRLEARGSPPAAARSSRLLLLPRRLPHRATEARGRRKPEEGGPGEGRRGHDSFSTDQAEEPRKARRSQRRPESDAPGTRRARHPVRCPPRPGPDPRRLRRAPPEQRGSSSCSAAGARRAVTTAAPKFTEEGAMQRETVGAPRPRSREAGAQPGPYLSGWADTSRSPFPGVPDRKITTKGGPGKSSGWLQDKVGGSSSTAKKTLPCRLGLFGKLQGRKCGVARVLPLPAGLAGSRSKHICLAHRGLL